MTKKTETKAKATIQTFEKLSDVPATATSSIPVEVLKEIDSQIKINSFVKVEAINHFLQSKGLDKSQANYKAWSYISGNKRYSRVLVKDATEADVIEITEKLAKIDDKKSPAYKAIHDKLTSLYVPGLFKRISV